MVRPAERRDLPRTAVSSLTNAVSASCCELVCQASFNGEFCNNRDASVHSDGSKSRFPKRVARALRGRNSLRVAMQIGGGACACYLFRDCGPRSAQTEQSGETASLISLSWRFRSHFVARPKVGRVLRCHRQSDRDRRAQGRIQRLVSAAGKFNEPKLRGEISLSPVSQFAFGLSYTTARSKVQIFLQH